MDRAVNAVCQMQGGRIIISGGDDCAVTVRGGD